MFTVARTVNGFIDSVVRFHSISQAREWAAINGHAVVTGYAARKALSSGACVRIMNADGKVTF